MSAIEENISWEVGREANINQLDADDEIYLNSHATLTSIGFIITTVPDQICLACLFWGVSVQHLLEDYAVFDVKKIEIILVHFAAKVSCGGIVCSTEKIQVKIGSCLELCIAFCYEGTTSPINMLRVNVKLL